MKILYLDSIAGIAGDMFAASFIDAGLITLAELNILAQQLAIADIKISATQTLRAYMQGVHIKVAYDQTAWQQYFLPKDQSSQHHEHVPYLELVNLINQSALINEIKELAKKILFVLAQAEAKCHSVSTEKVVFHEIGMADSLMDIVMAAFCIVKCKPDKVIAAPIKLGRGLINIAHGTQPVPPPVSASLVTDMEIVDIPENISNQNIELSTPTGLAILKTLNPTFSNEWPKGKVLSQGYGAGSKKLGNYPNLFRIVVLEAREENSLLENKLPFVHEQVIEITANYDDSSPEHLAWAMEKLFSYGALDVWQTASVGKKGRVLIVLSALISKVDWEQCANFILQHTTTFGLRYKPVDRLILNRYMENRMVDHQAVRVKIGCDIHGMKIKEKVEFEDMSHGWEIDLKNKEKIDECE
jgi:hypothetical protein